MQNDKKPGSAHFGGAKIDQVNIGDISNNHHHNYHTLPSSIVFNFLGQPASTGANPDVGSLLATYSKPRNEHGFPTNQPIILAQDAPLTLEQRRNLNDKVKQLESNFGQSGKVIWQTLHRIMGTASINDMIQQHYTAALTLLDNGLTIASLEARLAAQAHELQALADRLQQPCADCHDKDNRLAEIKQKLATISSVALLAFVTAGFWVWSS